MNTQPIFSFIMPVFNDGKHVRRAVESILDQDVKNLEVIVIDDGSSDGSRFVIKQLEAEHERVKAIYFDENKGACVARNEGAKIATGRYFSHLPADAMLYPGVARIWLNAFEANLDCDFVYGGYRFTTEDYEPMAGMDYFFEPFDPYMLEVSNYIDGSFPIRSEKYWEYAKKMGQDGLWDSNIKSLQDWDFWLSVVKNGGKGYYIPDIFFETVIPHKGGLSFDSAENWLERTDAIKKKHKISDRRLCVASLGAPWHGRNVAKMLDADFKQMPSFKSHRYDAIYTIGFYPEFAAQQDQIYLNNLYMPQAGRTAAKKVVHLVGSDVWQLFHVSTVGLKTWREYFKNAIDELLCESDFIKDELKELGIDNVKIVPLPPKKLYKPMTLPKEFTVAVYQPGVNENFYRPIEMEQIALACPDIKFKFFGNPGRVGKRKLRKYTEDANGNRTEVSAGVWDYKEGDETNIEDMGYLENMDDFIASCSAIMRFPAHDGLPLGVLEFLTAGRYAITSVPILGSIHISNKDFSNKRVVKELNKLKLNTEVNKEASDYWRKELNHDLYIKRIKEICGYNPKEYWEKRAESWDIQATEEPWDKEEVELAIEQIKEKVESVIDVGCGNGKWVDVLSADKTREYVGCDISEKLIDIAKKKHPKSEFFVSDLSSLKLEKKYDLAFCYTVLEHIPEGKLFVDAVNKLKQAAKYILLVEPTGFDTRFYCHDHNYEAHFNIIYKKVLGNKTLFLCTDK